LCPHADRTIAENDLDTPAQVPWWSEPDTTLGVLRRLGDHPDQQHAGHADIVRELIDGKAGTAQDPLGDDPEFWARYVNQVREAADFFKQ
jgi:hypothetical protein